MENEQKDTVVGDRFEAMLHFRNAYIYMPETNEVEYVKDQLIPTTWSDDYVFCMSSIIPKTVMTTSFSPFIGKEIEGLGQESLIITDIKSFIDMVENAANKYGYEVKYGYVNYYDEQYDDPYMYASLIQGISNIAFWKRNSYRNQQEFRFVFHGDLRNNVLELPLGADLVNISKVIDASALSKALIKREG
jgi:hypothetical protein